MEIKLYEAKRDDWDFILDLRNSFFDNFYDQTKPLEKEQHYEYMKKQSENPNFHHWVILNQNEKIGYVRILKNDIGIMVKKEYQGKGVASMALKLVEPHAKELGIKKLVALVKIGNDSSKQIFLKNNYELKMYWLEKSIE